MFRPVGVKYSLNYYNVVLENWAKLAKVNLGRQGYVGWALFVGPGPAFVIEHRGPGFPTVSFTYAWKPDAPKWQWNEGRAIVWETAISIYKRLSKQEG